jgi:antitoxin MazE
MKARVRTVRGELSVPIPAELAESVNVQRGTEVDVVVEEGKIIVRPLIAPKYSLHELLARVTDDNRHEVVDWGRPVGREAW